MAKTGMRLTGFDKLLVGLKSGNLRRNMRKHVGRATGINAHIMQAHMRKVIKSGTLAKNAALTMAVKRSSKPLVDFGDLWQAVTTYQKRWDLAFVGILRREAKYNIALFLHEGGNIPVTQKMRGLFFVLAQASATAQSREDRGRFMGATAVSLSGRAEELFSRYKKWRPLSVDTRVIKVPARPFAEIAFKETPSSVTQQIRDNWARAIQRALADTAAGK